MRDYFKHQALSRCQQMRENVNMFFIFLHNNSSVQALNPGVITCCCWVHVHYCPTWLIMMWILCSNSLYKWCIASYICTIICRLCQCQGELCMLLALSNVLHQWGHWPIRADCRLAPSQWETSLQSNAVSHWLGTNLESALPMFIGFSAGC